MGQFISFKSKINNPWFNPWFILLHTHSNMCATAQCSRPHQKLFFMNSTSIDKKFRYSLKKLPRSWKIYFFYFKHCVLTISKWHLPTCRAEIGEFHSIKCLFLTPIFFMITLFHTMVISNFFLRNLLNFLKI